jgi:hypothetical protein
MKLLCSLLTAYCLLVSPAWAAFPQVADVSSGNVGAQTNITVTLPATITAGQLLVVTIGQNGAGSYDWSTASGWAEIYDQSTTDGCHLTVGYKVAVGDEDGTVITVTGTADRSQFIAYAISGHDSGQAPQASAEASGVAGPADPGSLTPTGGAKDYLWLAAACIDGTNNITGAPANYSNFLFVDDTSEGLAIARRELNAASEDPGAFADGGAVAEWNAVTIAVHPAAAAAATRRRAVMY